MKKVLALLALLLISMGAMAQLKVTSEKKSSEFLTDNLMYDPNIDSYTLFFCTSNQFDDHMMIKLGNKEQAIRTIDDLISIVEIKEEKDFEIDNGYGDKYRIYVNDKYTSMWGDGYAASAIISSKVLLKAKAKLTGERIMPQNIIVNIGSDIIYNYADSTYSYKYENTYKNESMIIHLGKGKDEALGTISKLVDFTKQTEIEELIFDNFSIIRSNNKCFLVKNNIKTSTEWALLKLWESKIMRFKEDDF
jgi:hypothetical protein